ncbi:hypothetical protein GCM10022393_07660 [Aquimarina addita]|uniref:Protein BatD n=1 Tax=Aquimarina addita TaxID=870485 RepID=A0ABP7XBL1_9FLAO
MKFKLTFLILFLCITHLGIAQTIFEAKVDRIVLGVNEKLQVDFITNNEQAKDFVSPDFKNFKIINGPNRSTTISWVKEKKSYKRKYSYSLMPIRQGKFVIESAKVRIRDSVYRTAPVVVDVIAAVDNPINGNITDKEVCENLHLVTEVSNYEPKLNELITIAYKLYNTSKHIGLHSFSSVEIPEYNGFKAKEIDIEEYKIQSDTFKEDLCDFVILYKKELTPEKSGELVIEPMEVLASAKASTNKKDIFGNSIMITIEKIIASDSVIIKVEP